MDNSAIQAAFPPTASRPDIPPSARSVTIARGEWLPAWLKKVLTPIASLKLTVALFVLAILLVFLGTLAQKDQGVHTVEWKYFRNPLIAWIPFQVFVRFGQVFLGISPSFRLPGSFPFPGGWLLGAFMLVNLLAAHFIRFRMTWKRSGILLLHSGLVVLMISELLTGLTAVESRMAIQEGSWAHYAEDFHRPELAIVDGSHSGFDDVVVVPGNMLRKEGRLSHESLPFDLEIKQFMVNSKLERITDAKRTNLATMGTGLDALAVKKPEVSGVDKDRTGDLASTYLTLFRKGSNEPIGTYLFSMWLDPQKVVYEDKTYDVSLRPERSYKPYALQLLEFRHDKYPGTNIPSNYSSRVRLVDADRREDREVLIWMNSPLRHRGETIYQADVLPDPNGREVGTVLQVVDNPGSFIPYLSCTMVSLGLLVHFSIGLVTFLVRGGKK